MTHIEKNQLKNYTEVIWKDPILADQLDPENLLPKIVEFLWHQRYLHSPDIVSEIYKWYMFPPFLHIAIFYKDKINITSLEEPTWSVVDNILSVAYDFIMKINSTEMDIFYNKIIAELISYYKSVKPSAVPQVPSAIYVPNRNTIYTQTEINDLEVQAIYVPNRITTNTQKEENESELQVTSSNKRSKQSPDDTPFTPRDVITKS